MPYRIVALLALLLAGCGQKGALYLPQKAPVPAPAVPSPAAATPDDKSGAAPVPAPSPTTP